MAMLRHLGMIQSHLVHANLLIKEQFSKSNMELQKRINLLKLDNEMISTVANRVKTLQSSIAGT
jgi:hypothetical protein